MAIASLVQLATSSTEAIVPSNFPMTVPLLYFPFITSQVAGKLQVATPITSMAKLLQLRISTFMHCSILGGNDDPLQTFGLKLGEANISIDTDEPTLGIIEGYMRFDGTSLLVSTLG